MFTRVVVKASGQAFAGTSGSGIDPKAVGRIADEVIEAAEIAQVAVVVGGGNVLRGSASEEWQIDRSTRTTWGCWVPPSTPCSCGLRSVPVETETFV